MADDRYDDDEHFAEFNPHPYRGGYDIALTYGGALPPSASTCYPIAAAPPPPQPPQPSDPPRSRGADPEDSPAPPITGTNGPWNGFLDLFGLWYVAAGFRGGAAPEPWISAADYLFGYLPLLGPKRHESHNFGNLNYAYEMRRPSSPVSVQIDPRPRPDEVACIGSYGFGSPFSSPGYLFAHGEEEKGHVSSIEPSWGAGGRSVGEVDCSGMYGFGSSSSSPGYLFAQGEMEKGPVSSIEPSWGEEGRSGGDLFGWWPSESGGAEYHRERAIEEPPRYSCSYATNCRSVPVAVEVEPSWRYDRQYHEEVVESDWGYERRGFELPMGARVGAAEQMSSFDGENFVDQLFSHEREDARYATRSWEEEEPLPVEMEQFVPAWSRESCYREFHQQNAYQELKHENEYNDEYHGLTYWPF